MRIFTALLLVLLIGSSLPGCGYKLQKLNKREKVEEDPAGDLMNAGNILFKQGDYSGALGKFLEAKSIEPERKLVNYNIGACYFHTENYSEAARAFTDELKLNNTDPFAYIFRAHSYAMMGLNDQARADIDLALQLSDHAMVYYVNGLVFLNENNFEMAVNKFNAAIYKDPSDFLFYRDRGKAYLGLGKTEKACADFAQAKRINSNIDLSAEMEQCE